VLVSNWSAKIKLFNSPSIQEINKRIAKFQKLREQFQEIKAREEQQEMDLKAIEEWWEAEKKKIVPWTPEQRKYYEKMSFTPDEKTNERTIRSMTNTWKKLENR